MPFNVMNRTSLTSPSSEKEPGKRGPTSASQFAASAVETAKDCTNFGIKSIRKKLQNTDNAYMDRGHGSPDKRSLGSDQLSYGNVDKTAGKRGHSKEKGRGSLPRDLTFGSMGAQHPLNNDASSLLQVDDLEWQVRRDQYLSFIFLHLCIIFYCWLIFFSTLCKSTADVLCGLI